MESYKCPNCGSQSLTRDENNALRCDYCNSYVSNPLKEEPKAQNRPSTTAKIESEIHRFFGDNICPICGSSLKWNINLASTIILFIIFWPLGIVYLISNRNKKACVKCNYKQR